VIVRCLINRYVRGTEYDICDGNDHDVVCKEKFPFRRLFQALKFFLVRAQEDALEVAKLFH